MGFYDLVKPYVNFIDHFVLDLQDHILCVRQYMGTDFISSQWAGNNSAIRQAIKLTPRWMEGGIGRISLFVKGLPLLLLFHIVKGVVNWKHYILP